MDIYNSLTYFINVQVECYPDEKLVKKLLSLRCRVVLKPGKLDLSDLKEQNLLVANIHDEESAEQFHDVIIDYDRKLIEKYSKMKKRVIVREKAENKEGIWGIIVSSF